MTSDGVRNFLKFVGDLRPQTIERRLLAGILSKNNKIILFLGDATPTSNISPSETLGQNISTLETLSQNITKWETSTTEDVKLVKPEQTSNLTVVWPGGPEVKIS